MRKVTIRILLVTLTICAAYSALRPLYAAPGDFEITITIPAWQVADFRTGFLARVPNNILIDDPASTPENPLPQIPKYTDKQHIRRWTRRAWKRMYTQGKELLGKQAAIVDPNMLAEE